MRSTLVLVTGSFPYPAAVEHSFIEPELPFITATFERVIIVPRSSTGRATTVPAACVLDTTFADSRRPSLHRYVQSARGATAAWPLTASALRQFPPISRAAFRQVAWSAAEAGLARRAVESLLDRHRLDPRNTVVYSYWFDEFTTGALLVKERSRELAVATRAHGFDVYEERRTPPFIPFRRWAVSRVDRILSVSERGRQYLIDRYPEVRHKCVTARLGVATAPSLSRASNDGVVRVVSCSSVIALKRVPLIAQAVAALAARRPVRWTHFGDGPELASVRAIAATLPPSSAATLAGRVSNEAVHQHYQSQAVDVFINASTTEGVPVSIMEAMSYGVPVVATRVGGNGELVSDSVGALLSTNPSPDEIASAIEAVVEQRPTRSKATMDVFRDRIEAAHVHGPTARLLASL